VKPISEPILYPPEDNRTRIEHPIYKRRWDEQWKVGNRWQCGEIAYRAEFEDAFDWWLSEKAEWWLEKEWHGRLARGPVDLDTWTGALWADSRARAAWEVVFSLESARISGKISGTGVGGEARPEPVPEIRNSFASFAKHFRALVKSQSVPDNIPWAAPWDEIKVPVPAAVKRIRGKLNVPRERFRTDKRGEYIWAGKGS